MDNKQKGLNISAKSFLAAIAIIFLLMLSTYILTFVIPGGAYKRIPDENGNMIIDTAAGFSTVQGGLPFWKWILSPILVLGADGSAALIAVIIFLLVIGGVFNALTEHGLMNYMLDRLVAKFGGIKYRLMAVLVFFFMAMGSLVGSFEEIVPLVPIVVSRAIGLGWDAETGVAMSLLAVGCGFAAGVANPFTIGVAQTLAGLPMFSGIWLRLLSFACIYLLLLGYIVLHARRHYSEAAGGGSEEKTRARHENGRRGADFRYPDRGRYCSSSFLRLYSRFERLYDDYCRSDVFSSRYHCEPCLRDGQTRTEQIFRQRIDGGFSVNSDDSYGSFYKIYNGGRQNTGYAPSRSSGSRRKYVPCRAGTFYIPHLPCNELFYPVRICESFSSHPADCPVGTAFWDQFSAVHCRLCIR